MNIGGFNEDRVYITSDLHQLFHFQHKNIITYCKRPFDNIDEMDEFILKQFDELPNDAIIINNGDLFLNSKTDYNKLKDYYIPRMKGENRKLWIILGNHDRTAFNYVRNCPYNNPYDMYINMGFDRAYMYPILFEEKYLLSHEPVYLKPGSNIYNIFGHVHDTDIDKDYFNRNCENWAMMERVKKECPELNIDTSIKPLGKLVDLDNYFNVCWDKHHRILKWTELVK